ncbi:hypothetical protein V6N11_008930 [Hibiscus sabdariffa]|uniref:Uncharacterized protein n=1 Tax=Hibiscus sabdariffa TaxID=183260 RepID=A0ABR2PPA3_9ROSI
MTYSSATFQERYTRMAAKNRWEEQGFFFDDGLENYGLEPTIYNRLRKLDWFRFARQPARANLNWVLEFYTNNTAGEDTVTVHGRNVAAHSIAINEILGLPNVHRAFTHYSKDSKKKIMKKSKTSSASKALSGTPREKIPTLSAAQAFDRK